MRGWRLIKKKKEGLAPEITAELGSGWAQVRKGPSKSGDFRVSGRGVQGLGYRGWHLR